MKSLKTILKLLSEKYPSDRSQNPAILIYDDESGRIAKFADDPYNKALFMFSSIEELVKHLESK